MTEVKSGMKTSELLTLLGLTLITILNRKIDLGLTEGEIQALAGATIAYAITRGWVKTKSAEAPKQ